MTVDQHDRRRFDQERGHSISSGLKDTRTANFENRSYWVCQLLGWGGYGTAYYLAVLVPFHQAGARQVAADMCYCLAGVAGTHLLRLRIKRREWSELSYSRLIPRLIVGALLVGSLQTVALESSLIFEKLLTWPLQGQVLAIVATTVFFSALLVGLWLSVYLGLQSARRRRSAELRELRSQVLAREAQLRLLEHQLNPHFLFNCLNSLRGMIDEDQGRAQEMVTRLSELLRSSLRPGECGAVSIEEELVTVDAYLDLESVRFEERLRIRKEIDPQARAALFPSMLLQGLVENALKHGIARLPNGGELTLQVIREGDYLHVQVNNTGTLQERGGHGIGLANARERLRLLYGERARFTLREEPPGHVRASVDIPFQTREAACE